MIADGPDGAVLDVRVIPRAARTEIAGTRGGALLVRLNAPPVDGAANDELLAFLARTLGVPKSQLALISGGRARAKRVRVKGLTAAALATRLRDLVHER
jgi:uncharacterized protein (TIGR00251 family)